MGQINANFTLTRTSDSSRGNNSLLINTEKLDMFIPLAFKLKPEKF